jgi:hypothetical protein
MTTARAISILLLTFVGACGSSARSEGGTNGDAAGNDDPGGGGAGVPSSGVGGTTGSDAGGGADGSGMAGTTGKGGSGGGGASTAGSVGCTKPVFVTSDTNGGWSDGGYYVHNNMWNSSVQLGPETLYACSYRDW